MTMTPQEEAIVRILRLKRSKPFEDRDDLAELNEIQRLLENDAGSRGVELAEEYDQ